MTVVASRNRNNAERFAADFGVPVVAATYEDAAINPHIDAVYIATPPSEHESHALAAIAAGKPVLIEKPFAMDAASAARIIDLAQKKHVFCMEAMWTRFLPLINAVHDQISTGDIGELRAFRGDFFGANRPDAEVSKFDPDRGGGALMHRGVYAISLARLFLGPIEDVRAMASIGSTGVDEDCSLILRHETGAISTIRASLRTDGVNDVTIHGTKGVLHIRRPIVRPFAARITRFPECTAESKGTRKLERFRGGGLVQGFKQRADVLIRAWRDRADTGVTRYYRGNGYHYEAEALMRAVAAGKIESDVMPLEHTLDIMTVIDRARSDWQRNSQT